MNCENLERLLDSYLAGLLAPEQAAAVENHLAACPSCARLFLAQDDALDLLLAASWYYEAPSEAFSQQVMTRLPGSRRFTWRAFFCGALALSGLLSLTMLMMLTLAYPFIRPQLAFIRSILGTVLEGALVLAQWFASTLPWLHMGTGAALAALLVLAISFIGFRLLDKEVLS